MCVLRLLRSHAKMVIEERDRETQKEELYSVTKIKNLSSKKLNLTREIIKKSFATYSKSSTT